jgi:hypothetical protein
VIGESDKNLFRFKNLKTFLQLSLILFHEVAIDEDEAAILAVEWVD